MKTILVPVGGSATDTPVLETALTLARPLAAHLEFLHVRVGAAEAALYAPHIEFARGAALRNALDDLQSQGDRRATEAERHVREFCAHHGIDIVGSPSSSEHVTAGWRREQGNAPDRLMVYARHNDLVVIGRAAGPDGLPPDRLETLLMGCGRPLLLVPPRAPMVRLGTAMVCWKEAPEAARALAASLPLLAKATRVIVVGVDEGGGSPKASIDDLVGQLAWHGIAAEGHVVAGARQRADEALFATARKERADLLVMGGYGRWRVRETLFGGCTQAALASAELPILLAH
jgi:nucleotide-binding universal stress UspA family protein